ncbi:MAG: OmpA family protein [Bdellovibrionales bacterium]
MSSAVHTKQCLLVCAFMLFATTPLCASTSSSSVETYNLSATATAEGQKVLPSGMEWNRPLKAGDMVLQRRAARRQAYAQRKALRDARYPIGSLQAPQLMTQTTTYTPPLVTRTDGSSTAGMMLRQGMKNSLQQSGQNPDIPQTGIGTGVVVTGTVPLSMGTGQETIQANVTPPHAPQPGVFSIDAVVAAQGGTSQEKQISTLVVPPLTPDPLVSETVAAAREAVASSKAEEAEALMTPEAGAAPVLSSGEFAYQPGQEPKSLLLPVTAAGKKALPSVSVEEAQVVPGVAVNGMIDLSGDDRGSEDMPVDSRPDVALAAPLPLNESLNGADQLFEDEASIFGSPVDETLSIEEDCVPRVKKWTRSCQEAGYPADFSGEVVGESRSECPSGNSRDVWLSNSCVKGRVVAPLEAAQVPPISLLNEDIQVPVQEQNVVPTVSADGPVDAVCGSANGLAVLTAPVANLCLAGKATSVSGEGPWRWSCQGIQGGMTVSCAAPLLPQSSAQHSSLIPQGGTQTGGADGGVPDILDGRCGPAHKHGTNTPPVEGLCASGVPSRVNGEGPWRWACSGRDGGQAVSCLAPKITRGVCGAASRVGVDSLPARDLCDAGYASAVTGNGPWFWTCSGLYGGEAATCEAEPRVDAVCGPASMTGHNEAPEAGLCSAGRSDNVSGHGPWQWRCLGDHDGASVMCQAEVRKNGQCGSAHGGQFLAAPEEDLCVAGKASRVTGGGPWNWTCMGLYGGNSESCVAAHGEPAALLSKAQCGASADMIMLTKPEDDLCAVGEASSVEGESPWRWTCTDKAGRSVNCMTLAKTDGVCGPAAGQKTPDMPEANLCTAGSASTVKEDRKELLFHWQCRGFMGGGTAQCTAPMTGDMKDKLIAQRDTGRCGAADGQGFTEVPTKDLCEVGEASVVNGKGPWSWSCQGKIGASVMCGADRFMDGACGQANGSIQKMMPQTGLCQAGMATAVRGTGPWLWSCVGAGGGSSASCSATSEAQTRIDGTCGVAANAAMIKKPDVNLCDTGEPSAVYGDGPWTWTCSGRNGGVASTCQTLKTSPKAPVAPGPQVNGLCGFANGRAFMEMPEDGLCSMGTASAISGAGPWNWSCIGENGGMTVSCTAPLTPPSPIAGVCGKASGVSTLAAPQSALCSSGISSAVSGKGPWTWSCSGTNGGGAVSCVAPYAGVTNRGVPSLVSQALYPGQGQSNGKLVTPQLPKGSLPPFKEEAQPTLKEAKKKSLETPEILIPHQAVSEVKEKAPRLVPELPKDEQPLPRPKIEMPEEVELEGVKDPVLDSKGQAVPGARLSLKYDLSMISFAHNSDQLDDGAVRRLEKLALILKNYRTARITLVAYSSVDGTITPRAARRLSLKRALTIRDFLASKGTATNRVDIRPMGGNVPSGDMDRVDIKVN